MERKVLREPRDTTAGRIMDAATQVFADVGFAGARVDEIARRAGVNKATIYYHVGDKAALYARVLHDVLGDTAARIARTIGPEQGPEEKLKTYIRGISDAISRHPSIPSIMMRELASGGLHLPNVVAEDMRQVLAVISDILDEGVRKGVFTRSNPALVHLMVIGAVVLSRLAEAMVARHESLRESVTIFPQGAGDTVIAEAERLVLRALRPQ